MTGFVSGIYNFIYSLFETVLNIINDTAYLAFLDKQIIGGTLINIGLTWRELILYISTWFLIGLFIYFIFYIIYKIVYEVIRLVCSR